MNDKTILNPSYVYGNTVVNCEIGNCVDIAHDIIFCDKYKVIEKMNIDTGEADFYLCSYRRKKYVAKVYRRKCTTKSEITDTIKKIDSPYIAKIYDTGIINGFPFEIITYYKNGSLYGKTFSFEELKNNIIPCINEGLKVLHKNKIIHKDLKPSNIMLCDNGKDVAIIDFGTSSKLEGENTIVMTKSGFTPIYSAPETFRNLFLKESDYYSLGVTVFELFCGYTPYSNMSQDEIEQYTTVQKLPIPKDMPQELANLINSLTYYDITNRKNKNNPNRRWTYDEVQSWCFNDRQVVPGESVGRNYISVIPYQFRGKEFIDSYSLITELLAFWEEGKNELFGGYLAPYFKNIFNQQTARICEAAVEKAKKSRSDGDFIFWETMYQIEPDIKEFYWQGKCFESISELGSYMLKQLWKNDTSDYAFYGSILNEKVLSRYVELKMSSNKELKKAAKDIEALYVFTNRSQNNKIFYMMAYMLSGQRIFNLDGKEFRSILELTDYMKELLLKSHDELREFCYKLIDSRDNLNTQFECWLIALGKSDAIKLWRERLGAHHG